MKSKLHEIFAVRLDNIRQNTNKSKIRKCWVEYLDKMGVDRLGKLMTMITTCPENKIEFKDPFGEEVFIRIDKELAIKILTLGIIPDE